MIPLDAFIFRLPAGYTTNEATLNQPDLSRMITILLPINKLFGHSNFPALVPARSQINLPKTYHPQKRLETL